jgi:light-regulated signal transduction histidine kinase (bacteriophytochrome)
MKYNSNLTSHDLRSPLVNIEDFSKELELSLKDLSDIIKKGGVSHDVQAEIASIFQKEIPESMHYIRSSTKKMDLLLAGLLKLSRVGRTELKRVRLNMNNVMSDIMSNFEFQLKQSGARIEVLKLPPCIGDAVHIDRVFSILLTMPLSILTMNGLALSGCPGTLKGKNQFIM